MKEQPKPNIDGWVHLPIPQKIKVFKQCWPKLIRLSHQQHEILKKVAPPKEAGEIYALSMMKSFWDELEYALELSRTRQRCYIYHPTRSCFQKAIHLLYFRRQDRDKRDKIVRVEIMRRVKYLYGRAVEANDTEQMKIQRLEYQALVQPEDPRIEDNAPLKPMTGMNLKDMLLKTEISPEDQKNLYDKYSYLSEFVHSGLVETTMLREQEPLINFVSHTILFRCALEVLVVTDVMLPGHPMREVIQRVKQECEEISHQALR